MRSFAHRSAAKASHDDKAMKHHLPKALLAIASVVVVAIFMFKANPKHDLIRDAYIYGYPLVTMDMTRLQQTNVSAPDAEHAPMGEIIKMRAYPSVENKGAAAPNAAW